jgi:hypothetical protein
MKTPKIIIHALVSGKVRLTSELLDALKKHQHEDTATEGKKTPPGDRPAPAPESSPSKPATTCGNQRRMVFASPLSGRWVRCPGLLASCLSLLVASLVIPGTGL